MNSCNQTSVTNTEDIMRINFSRQKLFWIAVFLFLCVVTLSFLWISGLSSAQEATIISGRLIDTQGNPLHDITLYLRPYRGANRSDSSSTGNDPQTRTDAKGRFTFSAIHHRGIELDIHSDHMRGYEINVLSAEFGEIALHPDRGWNWSSIEFALEPGTEMENIIITADVRAQAKIRARVVYADGSPVTNTQIYVYRQTIPFTGGDGGYGKLLKRTDDDGYFVEYLHAPGIPTYFITFAVEHQKLYAKAIPFIVRNQTELVLKLNGTPGIQTEPPLEHSARFSALETYLKPEPVWVVNPTNGHAYKTTHAQTIKDAMAQAANEGAYLVAINDETEEKWLYQVFGNRQFWIGLSDAEEEGKWKWQSSEPLNYTNWAPYQQESGNSEMKDYVVTGNFDWGWTACTDIYDVGNTQNQRARFERAILERENISPKSVPDKN